MPPDQFDIVGRIEFRQDLTADPTTGPPGVRPGFGPGGTPPVLAFEEFRVLRASDLASFEVTAHGMVLVGVKDGHGPRLVAVTDDARLVVRLAYQHVADEAWYEVDEDPSDEQDEDPPPPPPPPPPMAPGELPDPPPCRALAAGPSRLVFAVLKDDTIDFSAAGVLAAMGRLELLVAPLATPRAESTVKPVTGPTTPSARIPRLRVATGPQLGGLAKKATSAGLAKKADPVLGPMRRLPDLGLVGRVVEALAPRKPAADETAIEAPFRLIISPSRHGGFRHATEPVASPVNPAHIELWHTRLGVRSVSETGVVDVDESPQAQKTIRALWARDLEIYGGSADPPQDNVPFRMSLTPADRAMLVRQTSDSRQVTAQPVAARRLYLSALGAWLDLSGFWATEPYANLEPALPAIVSWDHRVAMGRDYYVKVVYPGFLFPFGHRVALVKVTKRKINPEHPGAPQARLYQRKFLVIIEQEKNYDLGPQARKLPFRSVRIGPPITPDLVDPLVAADHLAPGDQDLFWPTLPASGSPQGNAASRFRFVIEAEDRDGRPVNLKMPLLFVADAYPQKGEVPGYYQASGQPESPTAEGAGGQPKQEVVEAAGQGIAVVPSGIPGDAIVEAAWLRFSGVAEKTTARPHLLDASVVVPAATYLAPQARQARMTYAEAWTNGTAHGGSAAAPFGTANSGEVFAQLRADGDAGTDFDDLPDVGVGVSYAGGTGQAGGFIQPDLPGQGLSRSRGLVADLARVASGTFNAESFLSGVLPKLFGLVNLAELIQPGDLPLTAAPLFTVEHPSGGNGAEGMVCARLRWSPPLRSWPPSGPPVLAVAADSLSLAVEVRSGGGEDATGTEVSAELRDFQLNLLPGEPLMTLAFDRLRYSSVSGRKPDVDVVFNGLTFDGILGFVDRLREVIPLDGFSDPPYIDASADGVTAGFDLALPNIAVGMFSLENAAVAADFRIPFVGEAVSLGFRFCTREKPFRLTVMMIGGGGFVALRLNPAGMELMEMALEAGASLSIDFGVASGSVSAMVGIYLRLEDDAGSLTGYFRIRGEVEVLAIASASLTLELALTYDFDSGKMIGRASLVIEVEVLCFSASVTVVCERRLAGSRGDPTFAEILGGVADDGSNDNWSTYCQAFAGA